MKKNNVRTTEKKQRRAAAAKERRARRKQKLVSNLQTALRPLLTQLGAAKQEIKRLSIEVENARSQTGQQTETGPVVPNT